MNQFDILLQEKYFTSDMKLVAKVIGVEATKKLIAELGGMPIYIPKTESHKNILEEYVKMYPETEAKWLALQFNISLSTAKRARAKTKQ